MVEVWSTYVLLKSYEVCSTFRPEEWGQEKYNASERSEVQELLFAVWIIVNMLFPITFRACTRTLMVSLKMPHWRNSPFFSIPGSGCGLRHRWSSQRDSCFQVLMLFFSCLYAVFLTPLNCFDPRLSRGTLCYAKIVEYFYLHFWLCWEIP